VVGFAVDPKGGNDPNAWWNQTYDKTIHISKPGDSDYWQGCVGQAGCDAARSARAKSEGLETVEPILGTIGGVKAAAAVAWMARAAFGAEAVAAGSTATAGSDVTVYRVFGGDARAQGFSWTTENPQAVSNFRDMAGLPSGGPSGSMNTADFMIKGRAKLADILQSRSALPLDGNRGGLPELIINPKNVQITDFSVLNH
jgi:hypothetical protein